MGDLKFAACPWRGICTPDCMLFLTATKKVVGDRYGQGHCSIAVLASHMASEEHHGGNYLMPTVEVRREQE